MTCVGLRLSAAPLTCVGLRICVMMHAWSGCGVVWLCMMAWAQVVAYRSKASCGLRRCMPTVHALFGGGEALVCEVDGEEICMCMVVGQEEV